jgi:hypothetical protein
MTTKLKKILERYKNKEVKVPVTKGLSLSVAKQKLGIFWKKKF